MATVPETGYEEVTDSDLVLQGDLIGNLHCPFPKLPKDRPVKRGDAIDVLVDIVDPAVVLTQSCDLAQGSVDFVIVCSTIRHGSLSPERRESTKKNRVSNLHLLPTHPSATGPKERMVAQFDHLYFLPLVPLRQLAETQSKRLRLKPPFREHLSQRFGNYFARVALPETLFTDE
ncbi:MAG: hypothetical protein L3K00_08020 [Thermoplasmata archaeon]|nr:hypothetical protein [Thermoplasmata archaeon]